MGSKQRSATATTSQSPESSSGEAPGSSVADDNSFALAGLGSLLGDLPLLDEVGDYFFDADEGEEETTCPAGQSREVQAGGGYVYRQYDDGTIEIIGGPKNVGRSYSPGHPVNDAITGEIRPFPKDAACSGPDEGEDAEEEGDGHAWYGIPTSLANGEIEWIQKRVDELTVQARAGEEFSEADKAFLSDLYWWIGAGGYAKGLYEASQLQRHYVAGDGETLEIDSAVYEESAIVQYAMDEMKKVMVEDLKNAGAIRNGGEIWSTDVLSPTDMGDQDRLGEIIQKGDLLAEQDNKRLKYCNNRFALKSFSEVKEGFWFWEPDQYVSTRWRVGDVWDFASFPEQKKKGRNDVSHIPLRNKAVLKLPDGLSAYIAEQDIAAEFAYFAEWSETWQPGDHE